MDVGNTQTVMGVFDGDELVSQWRISTNPLSTSDEIRAVIMPLLDADGISTSLIGQAVIASVVPQLEQAWRTAVKMIFQTDLLSCSAETAKDLIKISYPRPQEIGADRIADAVAAFHMYGAPVMVVDFGTATNIEVVDREGYFLGGAIAPGLQTSATALNHRGALLPSLSLLHLPDVSASQRSRPCSPESFSARRCALTVL
ncbi:MAG: type III pantothenate kinase [Eggerthellaceae bacterium]|nr:type III pantothenate kinase [Eggerthellaceae bacterium]